MHYRTPLIALVFLALTFAGCSKQSPEAIRPATALAYPKDHDLGVIEVSDGIQSRHDLGGGRVLIITPSILKDGSIFLSMSVEKFAKVLDSPRAQTRPDVPVAYSSANGDISFGFTPHIKQ